MNTLPEPLQVLVRQLGRLPGLGPKSAMRVAMTLLQWPEEQTRRLGQNISELRDKLRLCARCGALTETNLCSICSDPSRSEQLLCVVADWDSLLVLEEGGFFRGQYFILGGLLAPLENIGANNLELEKLNRRLEEGKIEEVVLALGATVEAETTATHVRTRLKQHFPRLHVSRLAQGIPLGSEVKYMDRETLRQSLQFRQDF